MNFTKNFFLVFISVFLLTGCDKVDEKTLYRTIVPIYEKMSTIRSQGVTVRAPQNIEDFGKIYLYQDYLFINEPQKGIHIYDNSNPKQPFAVSFLNIPGNVDMAVKDNILYADSYVDLLAFDLSNPSNPILKNRNEEVFASEYTYDHNTKSVKSIVLGYVDTMMNYEQIRSYSPYIKPNKLSENYSSDNSSYGQGGSMARFTLAKDYLYTVDDKSLNLFDVSISSKPVFKKNVALDWGIETIFPYKNNLFIGSNNGMYIYNIDKPAEPVQLSRYAHLRACDPVVVNDKYAFVTLRSGAMCGGVHNVLEVINIENLRDPKLIKSYQMQHPHGLGLYNNMLYLCEGDFGFKSYDVSDVTKIDDQLVEHFAAQKSIDVIIGPKSIIVIGKDGVCQYDYSDNKKLKLLSCVDLLQVH